MHGGVKNKVSYHDITRDGTNYILEWTHDDDDKGYITITEAIEPGEADEIVFLEAYDFQQVGS